MKMDRNRVRDTLAKMAIPVENQILSQKHRNSVRLLTLMQLAFMQVLKESDGFFGFKYTLLRGSKSTRKMEIEKKTHNQKISIKNQRLVEENNLWLFGVAKSTKALFFSTAKTHHVKLRNTYSVRCSAVQKYLTKLRTSKQCCQVQTMLKHGLICLICLC